LLLEELPGWDHRALARAATLVEAGSPAAENLLRTIFPHTGRAITVGITGAPGAGKSTIISRLVTAVRGTGRSVAVVAVDPSSPYSGGAILGDRIRMQDHHSDPQVFIRSMATRGQLGGLAAQTANMTMLLDAAGFDLIFIETVGVGQDEVDVARLADITAVVLAPGMGDDVQAIKAGIMEIADLFLLNKSDQSGAERLEQEVRFVLSLSENRDKPPVIRVTASDGAGIEDALAAIEQQAKRPAQPERRRENWSRRISEMVRERLMQRLPVRLIEERAEQVSVLERNPFEVVDELIEYIAHEERNG
jgi:LAO/AO transport system kinase